MDGAVWLAGEVAAVDPCADCGGGDVEVVGDEWEGCGECGLGDAPCGECGDFVGCACGVAGCAIQVAVVDEHQLVFSAGWACAACGAWRVSGESGDAFVDVGDYRVEFGCGEVRSGPGEVRVNVMACGAVEPSPPTHLAREGREVDADGLDLFELDDRDLDPGCAASDMHASQIHAVPGDPYQAVGHVIE